MLKINQDDYAYATARIRARETKLLDSSRLDRMLEASTPEEAYKVLIEAGYGEGSDSSGSYFAFERLLSEEMLKTYGLLVETAPQIEVVRAFQKRYDTFNVKVLLKAEFSNQDPPPILSDTGTIDKDLMKTMIRERDYKEMDPVMHQAILDIYDVFSRTRDPQTIDLLLDKASYQQFVDDLNAIENTFLHEIAKVMVDTTNIKMFIRARALNKSWDFLRKLLVEGGDIPETVYAANSDKEVDHFIEDIQHTKYGDAVQKGWALYQSRKNISGLEKLLDDFLMELVRKAKIITMGVEPFIAYLFAKEAEIRNVRMIMTGKINGLPVDLIRERLRLVYV